MNFITIQPDKAEIKLLRVENQSPYDVCHIVGLDKMRTDSGTLRFIDPMRKVHSVAFIVYEFGLLERDKRHFFAIGKNLYQGNSIAYAFDEGGETISCTQQLVDLIRPHLRFIIERDWVEAAIQQGLIERPTQSVNGVKIWEWTP
jgi:hypothetical protein